MAKDDKPKELTDEEKLIREAYERYELGTTAMSKNWERAREAIRFRDLEQWDEQVKQNRQNDTDGERPCLVLDKINQYVNQVKNDQRQNRPAIKVRAVDDKADPDVAEVFRGVVRSIEDLSRADVAYDTGMEHATDGGFGYWRVCTEYADDESFDQDIGIERIRNRFSVVGDPSMQQPDGSDSKWWIVFDDMSVTDFKTAYPDAKVSDFEPVRATFPSWLADTDSVTVAEYIKCTYETQEITSESGKKRKVMKPKWTIYKITAAEILEETEWPSRYGPIIQVLGTELDLDGELRLSGMVRPAMDAQRQYNYAASAFVERVALEPRVPYIGAEGQFDGHEEKWGQANRKNFAFLEYQPVLEGDVLVPPPQRQAMPGIPPGWQQLLMNMEHDIETSVGKYGSNLGKQTQASSGRQELALQQRGDLGSYHYVDNHALAIRQTGRVLVDLIPKIYDTERVVRILGEDGEEDYVRFAPGQGAPVKQIPERDTGKMNKYYDPTVGKYDVTVTIGPSYATKRMEGADFMMNLLSNKPEFIQIFGDLAFKSLDIPYAEEISERIRRTIPPEITGENLDDMDVPDDVRQVIDAARAQLQQKEQQLMQAAQAMEQRSQEIAKEEKAASSTVQKAVRDAAQARIEVQEAKHQQEMLRKLKDDMDHAEEIFQVRLEKLKEEQQNVILRFRNDMLDISESKASNKAERMEELWEQMQEAVVQSQRDIAAAMQDVGEKRNRAFKIVSEATGNEYTIQPADEEAA